MEIRSDCQTDCYKVTHRKPTFEILDDGVVVDTLNIMAKVHEKAVDDAITQAIIDYAVDNGYDEYYVIDEDFVKTALENEIKRRNNNVTD